MILKRYPELDFAKGIGIVLMVLGHCYSGENGTVVIQWLYSFHMPLFFLVCGILVRHRGDLPPFGEYLKKRGKNLLIPYYFWGITAVVFLGIIGRQPMAWLIGGIQRIVLWEGISAMWFLPCLILSELLFRICVKIFGKNKWLGHGTVLIIALIGLALPSPYSLGIVLLRGLVGTSFLYLGWQLAPFALRPRKFWIWLGVCAVHLILIYLNGTVSIAGRVFGNYLLYYLHSLLGTWLTIQLYYHLSQIRLSKIAKPFVWYGKHSLIVVCTSYVAIEMVRLLDYKLLGNILPSLGEGEGWVLCALVMVLEAAAIWFCNRFLWFTVGKPKPLSD